MQKSSWGPCTGEGRTGVQFRASQGESVLILAGKFCENQLILMVSEELEKYYSANLSISHIQCARDAKNLKLGTSFKELGFDVLNFWYFLCKAVLVLLMNLIEINTSFEFENNFVSGLINVKYSCTEMSNKSQIAKY